MKALDTSILLALLEGDPAARDLIGQLRGEEIVTTEVNFLELSVLSLKGHPRTRSSRRKTLDRLRRKITVLPIDSTAVELARRGVEMRDRRAPLQVLAMLGALEAKGCEELFTHDPAIDGSKWSLRVTCLTNRIPK
ncbi:MAG: type II toxin-antitoxin system VapC family toxin [Thermoplasmata archaeon]